MSLKSDIVKIGSLCLLMASAAAADASRAADISRLEGLWQGWIVYAPAEIELGVAVEIAPDAEGQMVGTIDVPSQKMKFYPLSTVEALPEGYSFAFEKNFESGEPGLFVFSGELSEDGRSLRGNFKGWRDDSGRNHVPFELERVSEAGAPRAEEVKPPVHALADAGDELRAAFNAGSQHVRLVILLSPT